MVMYQKRLIFRVASLATQAWGTGGVWCARRTTHPPLLPVAADHTPTNGALASILLGNRISTEIDTLSPLSPRSAIHAELEATRSAFHHLLTVIPDSIWQQKGINSAWTIKEEMWHIAWGMRFILDLIRNARRGIGLPRPPMFIADRLNVIYSRLRSARATRRSIARRYDTTHAVALSLLEIIKDDEWEISVVVFGQAQTVEELFYGIPQHFEEHAARIRPRLDET